MLQRTAWCPSKGASVMRIRGTALGLEVHQRPTQVVGAAKRVRRGSNMLGPEDAQTRGLGVLVVTEAAGFAVGRTSCSLQRVSLSQDAEAIGQSRGTIQSLMTEASLAVWRYGRRVPGERVGRRYLRACLVSSRVLASERLNVAFLHRGQHPASCFRRAGSSVFQVFLANRAIR